MVIPILKLEWLSNANHLVEWHWEIKKKREKRSSTNYPIFSLEYTSIGIFEQGVYFKSLKLAYKFLKQKNKTIPFIIVVVKFVKFIPLFVKPGR